MTHEHRVRKDIQHEIGILRHRLSEYAKDISDGKPVDDVLQKLNSEVINSLHLILDIGDGIHHSLVTDTYVEENGILFARDQVGAHAQYIVPEGEPF